MRSLTIDLVQTATHWHDPAANRALFDRAFEQLSPRSELVVLPEMFSTGFTMASTEVAETMDGPTVAWLRTAAARLGRTLCGSVVIESGGRFLNRFLWVAPDGGIGCYDKRHRFRMAGEHQHYAAGSERVVFRIGPWRILPLVCYDLRFPVWLRNREAMDYDLLLAVANWPAPRQVAWNTLLRARAIENLSYAVGVNIVGVDGNGVHYGGGSAAYDFQGRVLTEADDRPALLTVTLDGDALENHRREFPAWQDADRFQIQDDAPAADA